VPLMRWLGGILPVKKLSNGMVVCLWRGADLHMAQMMPLPLTVSFASVYSDRWLTWVVVDKGPLKECCLVVSCYLQCFDSLSW